MVFNAVFLRARGQALHDGCSTSSNISDLTSQKCNIAHARRSLPVPESSFRTLLTRTPPDWTGSRITVSTSDPEPAVAALLKALGPHAGWTQDAQAARAFLMQDVCELATIFREKLGYKDVVNVKLEAVRTTSCPKFHADTIGMRCLCTYTGAGTWYIENRHVRRAWVRAGLSAPGDGAGAAVEGVTERYAQQAQQGDLLFLKGHMWPGNYGMGAVHRSPDISSDEEQDTRLLLTVDDAVMRDAAEGPCACGHAH